MKEPRLYGHDRTTFDGSFTITPTLQPEHRVYLAAFVKMRRVKREASETEKLDDPKRKAAGLPIGPDGAYFVGSTDHKSPDVINAYQPPKGQPGLWCAWAPNEAGDALSSDDPPKLYNYIPWLKYLIEHFLDPWGYLLNGTVLWLGRQDTGSIEEVGSIEVSDNKITHKVFDNDDEKGA